MRRIEFASADLHDFASDGTDDHVKIFIPDTAAPNSVARDYTPRAFDPADGTLTIDFALHKAGPATAWAISAKAGDALEIGGPRGSQVVADDFDFYLLVGDETALPAIGRRVETLRPGAPVTTIVVVDDAAEAQSFVTRADWRPTWVFRQDGRDDATLLRAALDAWRALDGDGYVWIAAEGRRGADAENPFARRARLAEGMAQSLGLLGARKGGREREVRPIGRSPADNSFHSVRGGSRALPRRGQDTNGA